MKGLRELGHRLHPLHALREMRLFRAMTRRVGPIVRCLSPLLRGPVYLRLLANASLIADPLGQEKSIRETFCAILHALPQEPVSFWDIGANVGLFTWYCATQRPGMQILSFEPDPKNLECLRRTNAAWRLDSHLIIPAAVSDQVGRAPFHLDKIAGATGTLEDSRSSFNTVQYGVEPRVIEVETVTIDSLIAEGRLRPSIIKIDVEQAELRVLRGAEKLLREFPPILLIETFGERVGTFGLLRDCGYELFDSDKRAFAVEDSVNLLALPARVDPYVTSALAKIGYPPYAIAR